MSPKINEAQLGSPSINYTGRFYLSDGDVDPLLDIKRVYNKLEARVLRKSALVNCIYDLVNTTSHEKCQPVLSDEDKKDIKQLLTFIIKEF